MELPDFHIDHAEKIEWMIETNGWALEPVLARPEDDPPVPSYAYSIGVPAAVGFAEIAVFGLAPAAANVAKQCSRRWPRATSNTPSISTRSPRSEGRGSEPSVGARRRG